MTTKQTKREVVETVDFDYFDTTAAIIITKMSALIDKYGESVRFDERREPVPYTEYDYESLYDIVVFREETDAEFNKRIAKQEKAKQARDKAKATEKAKKAEREKKEYARLKKKFENS